MTKTPMTMYPSEGGSSYVGYQNRPNQDHYKPDPRFGSDWDEEEAENGSVLYRASFESQERRYVSYVTWKWVLISLFCVLMYGLGIFMLFYTPVIRHIARKDIRSRRLFVTTESVVYKTAPPACCPCCGVNRSEKHVMLNLVTDVQVSQSWFEAKFDLWSVKIENPGQTGGPNNASGFDVAIQGIEEPKVFKRLLLAIAHAKRNGHHVTHDHVREIISTGRAQALSAHGTNAGNPLTLLMGGVAQSGSAVGSAQAVSMFATMNSTLSRIEQLLTLQAQAQGVSVPPRDDGTGPGAGEDDKLIDGPDAV